MATDKRSQFSHFIITHLFLPQAVVEIQILPDAIYNQTLNNTGWLWADWDNSISSSCKSAELTRVLSHIWTGLLSRLIDWRPLWKSRTAFLAPREGPLATKWDSGFFFRRVLPASQQYHVRLIRLQEGEITFQIPGKGGKMEWLEKFFFLGGGGRLSHNKTSFLSPTRFPCPSLTQPTDQLTN